MHRSGWQAEHGRWEKKRVSPIDSEMMRERLRRMEERMHGPIDREAEWTIIGFLSRWTICQKEMIE